jgi:hypothetical protein
MVASRSATTAACSAATMTPVEDCEGEPEGLVEAEGEADTNGEEGADANGEGDGPAQAARAIATTKPSNIGRIGFRLQNIVVTFD